MEETKIKISIQTVVLSILLLSVVACAALPVILSTARTVIDVAEQLCLITAREKADEIDMTPQRFCSIGANLAKFEVALERAQEEAGRETGLIKDDN